MTKSQLSDSEILSIVATHPKIDILELLSEADHVDPYILCKELGLTARALYTHMKVLDNFGLIGGQLRYHITPAGRRILRGI